MKAEKLCSDLVKVRLLNQRNHFGSVHHLNQAYRQIKKNLTAYCSRYSLYQTVQGIEKEFLLLKGLFKYPYHRNFKHQSAESVVYLNTKKINTPKLLQNDHVKELSSFSEKEWPQFLSELNDEVYITIGCRRAFYPHAPGVLHHGILYITDGSHHGIFGYNKPKEGALVVDNDLHNSVSQHYAFYDELVIKGSKLSVIRLLTEIEKCGHLSHYDFVRTNCFSILIPALLKAKELGFEVPKNYKDRLLIVTTKEQNLGLGMITNPELRGSIEHASRCEAQQPSKSCTR